MTVWRMGSAGTLLDIRSQVGQFVEQDAGVGEHLLDRIARLGERLYRVIIQSIRSAFRLFPAQVFHIRLRSTKNDAPRSCRCS